MNLNSSSFAELMQAGLGRVCSVIVYVMIVVSTLGACTVYLVFCGNLVN